MTNRDADPPHGDFYVTVKDGRRTGFLLGPYSDMREALANVDRCRDLACDANDDAWFYAYGVSRAPIGTPIRTVFGHPESECREGFTRNASGRDWARSSRNALR